MREHHHDLGIGKHLLDKAEKSLTLKIKIDKLDFIQIKTSTTWETHQTGQTVSILYILTKTYVQLNNKKTTQF